MKDKIIKRAKDMFLKHGFKSVTMDDIAGEMCISKKTIYKYFGNKELLIEEGTVCMQDEIRTEMDAIISKKHNAIAENFEIKDMFSAMFEAVDSSPLYQLRKHYPEIYEKIRENQKDQCGMMFNGNILKGIGEGLYRNDIPVEDYVNLYYQLIFAINDSSQKEIERNRLETVALEYHIRAMATEKGIIELEKYLQKKATKQ